MGIAVMRATSSEAMRNPHSRIKRKGRKDGEITAKIVSNMVLVKNAIPAMSVSRTITSREVFMGSRS